MKAFMKRMISAVVIGAMTAALLVGCGSNNGTSGGGAAEEAAITMEQGSVSMGEARLYAYVMKSQYEAYYGSSIWDMEVEVVRPSAYDKGYDHKAACPDDHFEQSG